MPASLSNRWVEVSYVSVLRRVGLNDRIYVSYTKRILRHFIMGIVKISDTTHDNLRAASEALSRSINAQGEHWMRIGMLAELHPHLSYSDICQLLVRSTLSGGAGLSFLTPAPAIKPAVKTQGAAQ